MPGQTIPPQLRGVQEGVVVTKCPDFVFLQVTSHGENIFLHRRNFSGDFDNLRVRDHPAFRCRLTLTRKLEAHDAKLVTPEIEFIGAKL